MGPSLPPNSLGGTLRKWIEVMSDYVLLYILFAPFAGAIALIFASNRQPMLERDRCHLSRDLAARLAVPVLRV